MNENKTSITSYDKQSLKELIKTSLKLDGVPAEEIPLHSQAGILTQAILTNFDVNIMTVQNINRESSLLTCRNMDSLYSQVIQHTNEVELARPSTIELMIKIPIDYIQMYGKTVSTNTKEFIYTNDNEVKLENLPFKCDYSKIYIRVFDTPNALKDVRVFIINENGVETNLIYQRYTDQNQRTYILFDAPFSQIETEFQEYAFTDTQYERFVVETKNPIVSFSLTYIAPGGEKKPITPKLYYTRTTGDFLEYRYLNNNSILIDHNYIFGGFKPEVTGTLRVDLITTSGVDIKYNDTAKLSKLVPNNLIIEYLPIGEDYFESSGAKLASDNKEDIRNYVLMLKGSRKRIDTESDMNTWLLQYEGSSTFKPIMTVNNIKSRVFSIFTTLTFSEQIDATNSRQYTVPTDSGDILLTTDGLPKWTDGLSREYYSMNSDNVITSMQNQEYSSYVLGGSEDEPGEEQFKFLFISPFIHSYDITRNIIRSYLDLVDNVPYRMIPIYENPRTNVESRFAASNLRVDLKKVKDAYEYKVKTQIRADNPNLNLLENDIFKIELRFEDPEIKETYHRIKSKTITDINDNNKYDIVFDCTTNREIFGDNIKLTYRDAEDNLEKEIYLKISTPMIVDLYLKDKNIDGEYQDTYSKITSFGVDDFKFYEEVTRNLSVQSTVNYEGVIKFIRLPLVEKGFYDAQHVNRLNVYNEIKSLCNFINKEIYDELDVYSKSGNTLKDRQETLFDVSIKFVKSIGVSKKLQVGSDSKTYLHNLQLKPRFLIRKKVKEFDVRDISNTLNRIFTQHDFLSSELSMWNEVSDILLSNSDSIQMLQFINFDEYPSDYHTISQKTFDVSDIDTPEVLSLGFKFNEKLNLYEYEATYKEF